MKRILSFVLVWVVLLAEFPAPGEAWPLPISGGGPPITAPSALLIDARTQKVIYAKAPYLRRVPASTTKVMMALVVLEKMPLDRVIRIPRWAGSIQPSKIYLRPGERYRVRDLIHATLISSANDAAEVLAMAAAGSRAQFAQWMNAKARAIGCRDTHFTNASGLPVGRQYSTAYDLTLIMKNARKSSFIVDSMGRRYHTIHSLNGRKIFLKNHNRLLWKTESDIIGKTGWTRKGKACFVGRIQWKGREVLVSLLGSHRLWHDLHVLLNYQFGLAFFKIQKNRKKWSATETREIQQALSRAGYSPGERDGRWGPKTLRAVREFQKKNGLQPDGMVGPETCKRLTRYGLPPSYCRN